MNTKELLTQLKTEHQPIEYQFSMNKAPKVVMITGANGFLAQHIIKELVLNPEVEKIYGLVRSLPISEASYFQHIKVEYLPYNGMGSFDVENSSLDNYLQETTCFIHNAATVHNLKKLSSLYDSNVAFTSNIIRKISSLNLNLSFHYISTLSVFASSNQFLNDYSQDYKDIYPPHFVYPRPVFINNEYQIIGGYAQSKWLSEYVLSKTNCNIIRPGLITPHSEDPIFNEHEFITVFLNLLLTDPIVPFENMEQLKENTQFTKVDITPVNYISHTIAHILSSKHWFNPQQTNHFTHLANHEPVSLWQIINRFNTVSSQKTIQCVGYQLWQEQISKLKTTSQVLLRKAYFRKELLNCSEIEFNCDLFQTSLYNWSNGNLMGGIPPSVDIIEIYLKELKKRLT